MAGALPEGEPVPRDGALPAAALDAVGTRPFGVYVHVPFCASRCGYCDFNTYTASELEGSGASPAGWLEAVRRELDLAVEVLGPVPPADTVFVGGGTPSLLGAAGLAAGVDHVSAYALIVEDGTALSRRIRRGELPAPVDDVAADRYELVDNVLSAAGMSWYEVSNWSRSVHTRCRHNLGYWGDGDWW